MYFLKIENLVIYMDLVEYSIDLNMVTPTGIEVELINFKFTSNYQVWYMFYAYFFVRNSNMDLNFMNFISITLMNKVEGMVEEYSE